MNSVQTFDDKQELARTAAEATIELLRAAIATNSHAVWVLAGGSTPLLAYKVIVEHYFEALDWTKVTTIIGDERIGPLDGPDNNWHAIEKIIGNLPVTKIRPASDQTADQAAADYEISLSTLPKASIGQPQFDVVWLGVGEDGHTLSLFPSHSSLQPTSDLVIPVHDSPKAPSDRISLSLRALQGAQNVLIMASGAEKRDAVQKALVGGTLPIALAASIVKTHDGNVTWYIDKSVATTD